MFTFHHTFYRRLLKSLTFFCILLLLEVFSFAAPPEVEEIHRAIDQSSSYLQQSLKEDGMFQYSINMDPAINDKGGYNILRHAGTIYSLSLAYQLKPDEELKECIARATRYLQQEAIATVPFHDPMMAVWSRPEVNKTKDHFQAKLGGAGLGLVALVSMEDIQPGFTSLATLQSIGHFIMYMQRKDGSFYAKYIPSEGGRWDEWQSLYYPGEAALGLLMLHTKDPSGDWLEAAVKALQYLAQTRKNQSDVLPDHWALLATEKLLALEQHPDVPVDRALLIAHAVQICESLLSTHITDTSRPIYLGGFDTHGSTSTTSTTLEGLQAALSFLPQNHPMRIRIEKVLPSSIRFLLRAQVKTGTYAGAFPHAVGRIDDQEPDADYYNSFTTEVRIDYVQHAMSALIQYID